MVVVEMSLPPRRSVLDPFLFLLLLRHARHQRDAAHRFALQCM